MAKHIPVHLETTHNNIILCNNEIAFPAVRELAFYGNLKAVVVPEKNKEVYMMLQQFLGNSGVKVVGVNRTTLYPVLKELIATVKASSVWLMTFPYIIPAEVLSLLPGAFINFHYGLLPRYRGPNPILAQLLEYEKEGGITVHVLDEDIDTGPVILQHKIPIPDNDTFGIQLQKLGVAGADISVHLLKILQFSTVIPAAPQDITKACYFNKVTASQLMIQWKTMSAIQVIRLINACNPWNKGAGTTLKNNIVCFVEAEITGDELANESAPGTIVALGATEGLRICCNDRKVILVNIIYLREGFFSGKKLKDFGIRVNDVFV